jgi:hypothetical protein
MNPDVNVYAVGVDDTGRSVVWTLVNGAKFAIPTNVATMARLAEKGVPVRNGGPGPNPAGYGN